MAFNVDDMLERYAQSLPLNIDLITEGLRKEGRHVMADLVEGLHYKVLELETKLHNATHKRPARKNRKLR